MKVAYAFRRGMMFPYTGNNFLFPAAAVRPGWLRKIKDLGFDGIEVGLDAVGPELTQQTAGALRQELDEAGVPCVVVRGGGGYTSPRTSQNSEKSLANAIRLAAWLGASVVNTGLTTPPRHPGGPGSSAWGEPTAQGSSREATEADFEQTAAALQRAGTQAAAVGLDISIEVHQHSIVDNSWSALHLLRLIDRPNVGINPDLGNIYWQYDVPEETAEHAIVALAPRAKYWHCKNLLRMHLPSLHLATFQRVPLPDGDIDYRFAITAMREAGYQGYLAVEGVATGDQLTADGRSATYVRSIFSELEQRP